MRRLSSFVFVAIGFAIFSCQTKKEVPIAIAGIYLNSYTADVMDPATGELWGKRSVRDTLFIKMVGDLFQVSNKRWMLNTYDRKGWVSSMVGEPSSLPVYLTAFNDTTYSLTPLPDQPGPPLYVEGEKIHVGVARALTYLRLK